MGVRACGRILGGCGLGIKSGVGSGIKKCISSLRVMGTVGLGSNSVGLVVEPREPCPGRPGCFGISVSRIVGFRGEVTRSTDVRVCGEIGGVVGMGWL